MKKLTLLLIATLLSITLIGCTTNDAPAEVSQPSEAPADDQVVVATVDDTTIDLAMYQKAFKLLEKSYNAQYGEGVMDREVNGRTLRDIIKGELLSSLVNEVVVKETLGSEFTVEQATVDKAFEDYKSIVKLDDEATQSEMTAAGIDDSFIKERIRMQMYLAELQKRVGADVEQELAADGSDFDNTIVKVDAQHILVKTEEEAKAALERINAGESFDELAKELSQDPGSGANGGQLGYFTRGRMVPAFEQMAFSLKEGEVSEPVQTQFGFHIIKVNDSMTVAELKADADSADELAAFQQQYVDSMVSNKFYARMAELRKAHKIEEFADRVVLETPETEAPQAETATSKAGE